MKVGGIWGNVGAQPASPPRHFSTRHLHRRRKIQHDGPISGTVMRLGE